MKDKISYRLFIIAISSIVATSFSIADESCVSIKGCAKKVCEVKKQIEMAKKYGNNDKIKGLNKALSEINDNCEDKDIISKIKEDLEEESKELEEHKNDLAEAIKDGKKDKIEKYNKKIIEDKEEIEKLKKEILSETK